MSLQWTHMQATYPAYVHNVEQVQQRYDNQEDMARQRWPSEDEFCLRETNWKMQVE